MMPDALDKQTLNRQNRNGETLRTSMASDIALVTSRGIALRGIRVRGGDNNGTKTRIR